jgi:hypothetical protein
MGKELREANIGLVIGALYYTPNGLLVRFDGMSRAHPGYTICHMPGVENAVTFAPVETLRPADLFAFMGSKLT